MVIFKKNKIMILIVAVVIVIGVYWLLSSQFSKSDQSAADKGQVFNGESKQLLGPIKLTKGLALLTAKNQTGANDNFGVVIYADDNNDGQWQEGEGWTGRTISVGYEEAESYDGTLAFKAEDKGYFVDVDGGRWQIIVSQPEKLSKPAPDFTSVSGRGSKVTDKFWLPAGEHTFKATNDGGGNFIVYLVDQDGNFTGRLVNEIGAFEGDFSVNVVFDDNYVFAVEGGNNWTISKTE